MTESSEKTDTGKIVFKHIFTFANKGLIDNFYTIVSGKFLGEGSYGKVSLGTNKLTGAQRAIKEIDISKIKDNKRFQTEIEIQMELDHPHIVKLFETFVDARVVYLVMELCTGGELFDRIVSEAEKHEGSAFGEKDAAKYMGQIMGAIQYLHVSNIAHRDIKPENFLMANKTDNSEIKVIDFGLAKSYKSGEVMSTKAGTPYYVAPEVLKGSYSHKCDIWSCGVICYILLCGYPPFYGDKDEDILASVKRGKFDFPSQDWSKNSHEAKDFIKTALTFDAGARPNADALLMHPWIQGQPKDPTSQVPLDKNVLARMREFKTKTTFQQVALTVIAQNCNDDDINELRQIFFSLDKNKDGTLSKTELLEGMKKQGLQLEDEISKVIDALDTDNSGTIDYSEFLAATLSKKQYQQKASAWSAFRQFDADGDGRITKDELKTLLRTETDEVAINLIKEVDTDGDGTVSFEEFQCMLNLPAKGESNI